MNDCPLFYIGEIVLYDNKLVEILDARYYRDKPQGFTHATERYAERYIIRYVDGENNFGYDLNIENGDTVFHNVNRCAGEYLTRVDLLNTEEIFNELYERY